MTCQHGDQQIKSSLGWLSFTLRRQVTHSCTALRSSERSASYTHAPPPHRPSRLPHCLLCPWCLFFSLSEAPPQTSPALALCSFRLLPWAECCPSLVALIVPFVGFGSVAQSRLAFPSPVDPIPSGLSAMTRLSQVALHGMAHSFIELDKAVVHVIRLVSFLWLWFSVCLPSDGEGWETYGSFLMGETDWGGNWVSLWWAGPCSVNF